MREGGRERGREGGLVVRALDLHSEFPGFKYSSIPLSGFVFRSLEFNFYTLCK